MHYILVNEGFYCVVQSQFNLIIARFTFLDDEVRFIYELNQSNLNYSYNKFQQTVKIFEYQNNNECGLCCCETEERTRARFI